MAMSAGPDAFTGSRYRHGRTGNTPDVAPHRDLKLKPNQLVWLVAIIVAGVIVGIALVALAAACLHPGAWLLCSTNHRGITPRSFLQTIRAALPRHADLDALPMPPDFNGHQYLKCICWHPAGEFPA